MSVLCYSVVVLLSILFSVVETRLHFRNIPLLSMQIKFTGKIANVYLVYNIINPAAKRLYFTLSLCFPFSCRSTKMEEHLFWKFEGAMLAFTVVFAILVVARQRSLDRQASDKVRRQIESI